jgi:hypothetical protein
LDEGCDAEYDLSTLAFWFDWSLSLTSLLCSKSSELI